jgi:hypothetical protein
MAGATIFVMYANGEGNVTISARDGDQGHVEPVPDSTLQSGVTLLAGSGIVDGQMIANVYCMCPFPSKPADAGTHCELANAERIAKGYRMDR